MESLNYSGWFARCKSVKSTLETRGCSVNHLQPFYAVFMLLSLFLVADAGKLWRFALLVPSDYMWALLPDVIVVIISEVVVDVIKHAFITKFNEIPADVSDEEDASTSFFSLSFLFMYFSACQRSLDIHDEIKYWASCLDCILILCLLSVPLSSSLVN